MVAQLPSGLLHCLVPNQTILTVDFWPGWINTSWGHLERLHYERPHQRYQKFWFWFFNTEHTAWRETDEPRHRLSHAYAGPSHQYNGHALGTWSRLLCARWLDGGSVATSATACAKPDILTKLTLTRLESILLEAIWMITYERPHQRQVPEIWFWSSILRKRRTKTIQDCSPVVSRRISY